MRTIKTLFFIILLVLTFASCRGTLYNYELEMACKVCEPNGGVNRIEPDVWQMRVYCNDGTKHVIND